MNFKYRAVLSLLGLLITSQGFIGCEGGRSPVVPSVQMPPQSAPPQPLPSAPPVAAPGLPALTPSVASITPNAGSTGGGAWGTITGSDFQTGVTVRFGDNAPRVFVQDSNTLLFWTEPHKAGTVNVTVTNPGGRSASLASAFTYAPADSFDANGMWVAHAGPDFEIDMSITIRNDQLISFSCGASGIVTPSVPTPIVDGAFSFLGNDGTVVSGVVVSPVNATGTVNLAECAGARWGDKRRLMRRN